MHVDLIEALRCPHAHEDGWLVASADVVEQRRILQGVIGCPQCGSEWRVHDGALSFGALPSESTPVQGTTPGYAERATPADESTAALRLAALLDLRDASGAVVLVGEHAHHADTLHALTGVLLLVVNAPAVVAGEHSRLYASNALPLGVGTVRGIAVDGAHSGPDWIASAARALERGGRLVAPVTTPVPPEIHELARDEQQWVGELRVAASGLVPLRRSGTVP